MAETIQRHKRGGLYFEDFEVGKTYEHRYTRTVTQMVEQVVLQHDAQPVPLHSTATSARPKPIGDSH